MPIPESTAFNVEPDGVRPNGRDAATDHFKTARPTLFFRCRLPFYTFITDFECLYSGADKKSCHLGSDLRVPFVIINPLRSQRNTSSAKNICVMFVEI